MPAAMSPAPAREAESLTTKLQLDVALTQKADLQRQLQSERSERLRLESLLETVQADKAMIDSQLSKVQEKST